MTTTAITFLVLSLLLVWGGLAVAILRLRHDGRAATDGHDDADGAPAGSDPADPAAARPAPDDRG